MQWWWILKLLSDQCKKGDDIATFLAKCRQQFPELRGTSVENLMYIKVYWKLTMRLCMPTNLCTGRSNHTTCMSPTSEQVTDTLRKHYTFYDFIINKARGKSGPLFNFDVHDDVRLIQDATVEKDEVRTLLFLSTGMNELLAHWFVFSLTQAKLWKDRGIIDSNM